ncbi:hypothetical protein [Prochlorococcus marinus]|uniref:hypothetical protein n=1 Tax=Prochlorococcus marinus TaxID=1219 RepID=UPI0009B8E63D|nr:hypothetical protein [Prochlorococcus marinus]
MESFNRKLTISRSTSVHTDVSIEKTNHRLALEICVTVITAVTQTPPVLFCIFPSSTYLLGLRLFMSHVLDGTHKKTHK